MNEVNVISMSGGKDSTAMERDYGIPLEKCR